MDQAAYDLPTRPRRKRRLVIAILLGSSIAMLGAATMSLAVFTDQNTNNGTWSTGTIVLGVNPATVFTASDIMPGDTGNQTVTVDNNGTGELRYAMTTSAGNSDGKGLAAQLNLRIDAGACGATTGNLYDNPLNVAKLGDPTQGPQSGDRTVAAAGSDTLCFTWTFPKASGNTFQNAKTTAIFTFDAEQTANNP